MDYRQHIGGVENMLDVDRVGGGRNPRVRILACLLDRRKVVRLGKLPAHLRGVPLIQGEVAKVAVLKRVTYSGLVDHRGADVPNIGYLRLIVGDVAALPTEGVWGNGARVDLWTVVLRVGHREPVVGRNVVIQASEILSRRVGSWEG